MRTTIIVFTGISLLHAGCATAPPGKTVSEQLPVPPAWTSAGTRADSVQDDWWKTFNDPTLEALVAEGLTNSHDLKIAAARLDAAAAQAQIAGASLYPQLDFDFGARRQQQVFVGLPIPSAGDQVLKSRATTFSGNFNISWELDVWGRIRSGHRATRADVRSAEADAAAARHSLAAHIASAWTGLIELQHQLRLARATADSYAATTRQVRDRYERGLRSPLDVRLSESSESAARALLAQRESQQQAAARQLELLVGRYPAANLDSPSRWPELTNEVPAGLPSELLDRRPDLRAAEERLSSANLRVKEARAALFPRLSLTASGGRTSAELEDLLSSQFNIWSLAANLAQPLFQGGRLRGNVRLQQARAREALENYVRTALQAFSEVETALADETLLRQREEFLASAAADSIAARELAESRYRSGLETFVTVLEAQRRAFETESQWIAARRLRIENRIRLHLALGGGFNENAIAALNE